MKKTLLLIFMFIFLFSCGSKTIDQGIYKRSQMVSDLLTPNLKSPWHILSKQPSDLVIENRITKSLFIFSSACRSFETSTLEHLSSSLMSGLSDLEILERQEISHQSRAAIGMRFNASLDGVRRYMQTLTTLKNYCIYDYSLIATSEENLLSDNKDFSEFINLIILN